MAFHLCGLWVPGGDAVGGLLMRRYPLEPFFALTGWTLSDVQDIVACNGSEWRKRKAEGLTEQAADRVACAAGFAPLNIWPDFGMDPCEECGEPYPPSHPRRRFCSVRCADRNGKRRRYRTDPATRARKLARKAAYNDDCRDYKNAAERRRYWSDPERERARKRRKPQVRRGTLAETSGPGLAGNENRDLADTPGLEVADRAGR